VTRRVLITGLGPVTAFGIGIEPLRVALREGRTAVRRIARFDPSGFACRVGAEIAETLLDVRSVVPKSYRKATKVMARDIELAVAGAHAAVSDAGLITRATEGGRTSIPSERMGCHIGAGLIAAELDELTQALATSRSPDGSFDVAAWGRAGMTNLTPLWLLKYLPNMLACHVTIVHGCEGPSNTITCAEASSGLSIGESLRVIERRDADLCLSGGAETKVHLMGLLRQEFARRLVGSLSPEDAALTDDEQAAAIRPFDPSSRGTVLGEGGGILALESAESAESRRRVPYAELAGFGASQTINSDTVGLLCDPEGEALAECIEASLADAGLAPRQIDALVPLASGIPESDHSEAAAIRRIFGDRADSIPLVTVAPAVGNCCAGHGAVAAAVAAQAIRAQELPARLHSTVTPGVNGVATAARGASLGAVVVFGPSFGGQNTSLVLRRVS
jgi:3-oxoacyl-[acyl-carrier-protein] synthase II